MPCVESTHHLWFPKLTELLIVGVAFVCAECVGMRILEIRKQNPESTSNLSSDLTMKSFTHTNHLDTFNSASLAKTTPNSAAVSRKTQIHSKVPQRTVWEEQTERNF